MSRQKPFLVLLFTLVYQLLVSTPFCMRAGRRENDFTNSGNVTHMVVYGSVQAQTKDEFVPYHSFEHNGPNKWSDQYYFFALLGFALSLAIMTFLYFERLKQTKQLDAQYQTILQQRNDLHHTAEEIKANNETLIEKNNLLTALLEERDQINSMLSHDLRSPLNRIKGLVNIIDLSRTEIKEEENQYFTLVHTNIESMLAMLQHLLDDQVKSHQALVVGDQDFKPAAILKELHSLWSQNAKEKSIQVHLQTSIDTESLILKSDHIILRQILDNLISNAIKFSPIGADVWLAMEKVDNNLVMTFKDSANGFTPEELNHLFQKNQSFGCKPTGGEKSTGLGLLIIHQLTQRIHGQIFCESVYGEGSTFTLTIPLA